MAKINYRSQFSYSFAGQAVLLRAKVAIGASGAPTLQAGTGMGITSITRASAGQYVIALDNPFYALMDASVISESSAAPAAPVVSILADSANSASAPSVTIQLYNASGTATDPASGELLLLKLELNRSSLPY